MTHLLVKDGVVVNWIVIDPAHSYTPPEGHVVVEHAPGASPGWVWDGEKAIDPNPPPPSSDPVEGKVL